MGLKTFSLMMLVMNMAFLTNAEASWFLRFFGRSRGPEAQGGTSTTSPELSMGGSATSSAGSTAIQETATKIKRK